MTAAWGCFAAAAHDRLSRSGSRPALDPRLTGLGRHASRGRARIHTGLAVGHQCIGRWPYGASGVVEWLRAAEPERGQSYVVELGGTSDAGMTTGETPICWGLLPRRYAWRQCR